MKRIINFYRRCVTQFWEQHLFPSWIPGEKVVRTRKRRLHERVGKALLLFLSRCFYLKIRIGW